jgi:DNA primase
MSKDCSYDSFLRWAKDKFGDVLAKGDEVRINSVFAEDKGHHLWCSPSGGKYKRKGGCYHCFKTDKKGTLIGLIMLVDNCTYHEAKGVLSGEFICMRELEEKLDDFFVKKAESEKKEIGLALPLNSFLINDLEEKIRSKPVNYLQGRKLPIDGLYYCISGDYGDRIIIPYYDIAGKLIYFNGRAIGKSKLRYFGPEKTTGVGKGDVLYFPSWPQAGSKVYLTEGEFDALTLKLCGFNSAACGGKILSERQIEMLKGYQICLSLDEDRAGLLGLKEMSDKLIRSGIRVTYVRPPFGFKDWNEMLIKLNSDIIKAWVVKSEKFINDAIEEFLLK